MPTSIVRRKKSEKIRKPKLRNARTKKNKSYLKKIKLEEELKRNLIKESATKTPVVSMGHGIKLINKSRKQLHKGKVGNAMASLLTAVAVLSATGPFNKHERVKEERMTRKHEGRWTGDPDELMKWHMDEQYKPKNYSKTRKYRRKTKFKNIKAKSKTRKANSTKSKTRKAF